MNCLSDNVTFCYISSFQFFFCKLNYEEDNVESSVDLEVMIEEEVQAKGIDARVMLVGALKT